MRSVAPVLYVQHYEDSVRQQFIGKTKLCFNGSSVIRKVAFLLTFVLFFASLWGFHLNLLIISVGSDSSGTE